MTEGKSFDPSKYLSKVGSSDYLEVKWRLVWFRERHPDGEIETTLVEHVFGEYAVFKARVSHTNGIDGWATGYGSETPRDFRDYLEKAETKAIGRALAALGYGTQFSAHEFGGESEVERPVDAPLPARSRSTSTNTVPGKPTIQNPGAPVSIGQLNYIKGMAKQLGMVIVGPDGDDHTDEAALDIQLKLNYDTSLASMTIGQASEVIEGFKEALKSKATQGQLMPNGADRYTS